MPGNKENLIYHLILHNIQIKALEIINIVLCKNQYKCLWNNATMPNTRENKFKPLVFTCYQLDYMKK